MTQDTGKSVWFRHLGRAWKIRVNSRQCAERVRDTLAAQGWRCTGVTPAFDSPDTVLFRVTDDTGDSDRSLEPALRGMSDITLMNEPA
jgi:hypothetical protein